MAGEYRTWSRITFKPAREKILPHALLPYLQERSRILDVGCNRGSTALFLGDLGHAVHGIDVNPEAIQAATHSAQDFGLSGALYFEVVDLLDMDTEVRFDAVTMVRFLTCLPDLEDWRKAVSKAGRMLADEGVLYVNDFLCIPESEDYRRRYDLGAAQGWRTGNFAVHNVEGTLEFVAHHHTAQDLAELTANYRTEMFRPYASVSLHGNSAQMFEFILRKPDFPA